MDRILATDIYERLSAYRPLESVELVLPSTGDDEITVDDIERMVPDTTSSAVLIIDVRNQTRTRLLHAYSTMVRRNRPDFNVYCYTVVIGGGPASDLRPGTGIDVIRSHLTDLRIDYSPGACFIDPLLHYSFDEIQHRAVYENNALPEEIPQQLQKHFKGHQLTADHLRRYFRADGVADGRRTARSRKREKALATLYRQLLKRDLPDHEGKFAEALSERGAHVLGEALRFNVYPFFFNERVADLVRRAEASWPGYRPQRMDRPMPGTRSA